LEFNVPFQHKCGYIRDKRPGVESYPYPVKEKRYINLDNIHYPVHWFVLLNHMSGKTNAMNESLVKLHGTRWSAYLRHDTVKLAQRRWHRREADAPTLRLAVSFPNFISSRPIHDPSILEISWKFHPQLRVILLTNEQRNKHEGNNRLVVFVNPSYGWLMQLNTKASRYTRITTNVIAEMLQWPCICMITTEIRVNHLSSYYVAQCVILDH